MLLALALLVPGVRANDANDTFAANYLTILAKLLNRCAYFHISKSSDGVVEWWNIGRRRYGHHSNTPALHYSVSSFRFINNSPHRQIVGRELQSDPVARGEAGKLGRRSASHKGQQAVPIGQLHSIGLAREHFHDYTFNFEGIRSGHVRISGWAPVMSTVCSKWADNEPSSVTTVQPSFKIFTPGNPAFTIGSMAMVIPGRN